MKLLISLKRVSRTKLKRKRDLKTVLIENPKTFDPLIVEIEGL
jgi:hypothetical protein